MNALKIEILLKTVVSVAQPDLRWGSHSFFRLKIRHGLIVKRKPRSAQEKIECLILTRKLCYGGILTSCNINTQEIRKLRHTATTVATNFLRPSVVLQQSSRPVHCKHSIWDQVVRNVFSLQQVQDQFMQTHSKYRPVCFIPSIKENALNTFFQIPITWDWS